MTLVEQFLLPFAYQETPFSQAPQHAIRQPSHPGGGFFYVPPIRYMPTILS